MKHIGLRAVYFAVFIICINGFSFVSKAAERTLDYGKELVIVIDPGHGGENEGTIEYGFLEKEMTLATATSMYEILSKFDDVKVYMTRTEDVDLSLKQRAEFAKSVDADFLFSIHYNASVDHDLFGSEIWISQFAPYNSYGVQFGDIFLNKMAEKGLFIRGIKTKQNKEGSDYYGIIRQSVKLDIPAVILEHCHVDEDRDNKYCRTLDQWYDFGKTDAYAVAEYFGLKSSLLNIDYSLNDYVYSEKNGQNEVTLNQKTPPDICSVTLQDSDEEKGLLRVNVKGEDFDSLLMYYDYSYDGGLTYSKLMEWPGYNYFEKTYDSDFDLEIEIPSGIKPEVIVRCYNLFDDFTESNVIYYPRKFEYGNTGIKDSDKTIISGEDNVNVTVPESGINTEKIKTFKNFLTLSLLSVSVLFLFLLIFLLLYKGGSGKKKNRRKKRH
ncbi:MAG: N-acetylmuramoyl-L-alanine amidase [Acetatifactor sp.]|nr:N-acetylmuramoyl-L-alanine amidase [Acetatifactor sp.]